MAVGGVLVVHVTSGELRRGIWCDTCLKPAVVECDLYILHKDGPHMVGTWRRCMDCES